MRPEPISGILDIEPYLPGKSKAPAGVTLHKLSSNETPLGASPKALEAAQAALSGLEIYPDGQSHALKTAIAEVHGLRSQNILCQCYLAPGDEAIHCEHGFLVYNIQIKARGATAVIAPETNATADVDAILSRVSDKTRLVFLANPNNPTGTYLPFDEVRRLHAGLPGSVILILDAAYAEYVRRNDYAAGLELVSEAENVVMTRTFSKIYGLAALRIGWMYAPEAIISVLDRVRGPFNLNALAIAAGAAAMKDRAFVEKAADHNARWLDWTIGELNALGLTVTPSVGNFVLIHFPEEEGRNAAEADAFLTARGFILRRVTGYGFPNALRMSIGSEDANRGVIETLREFLKAFE